MVFGFAFLALPALLWSQDNQTEKAFHQGTAALHDGQLDAAAADFSRVATLAPTFAEAYFNLGLVRLQQGRLDDAVASLAKSVALKPRLRGANLFLGIASYRDNDYAKATAALKREALIDPANAKVFMWLGIVQLAAGDVSAATVTLDKAAALSPGDVDILYHRGRAHMLVSKESYERMYKADPNSWRVHQVLAQSFLEEDRLDEAVHECQQALDLKAEEPGLHEQLGDIYQMQNNLPKAEEAFEEELKINPENSSSMYKLAVVSIERSKPQVAAELLTELLRRSPRQSDAQYQLGRAQAQLGNTDGAIHSFSAAVADSTQPDSETVRQSYYQLAQLYRREQKPDESRAALDSFLRLKQQADAQQAQKLQDKLKRTSQMQETDR